MYEKMSEDYIVLIPIMYDVVLDELNCYEINASNQQIRILLVSVFVSYMPVNDSSSCGSSSPLFSTSVSTTALTSTKTLCSIR